jgi:ABC transporter family protein
VRRVIDEVRKNKIPVVFSESTISDKPGRDRMLIVAAAVAIASSVLGTIASFHINGSSGPCIVLIQAAFFGLALLRDQALRRRHPSAQRAALDPGAGAG